MLSRQTLNEVFQTHKKKNYNSIPNQNIFKKLETSISFPCLTTIFISNKNYFEIFGHITLSLVSKSTSWP